MLTKPISGPQTLVCGKVIYRLSGNKDCWAQGQNFSCRSTRVKLEGLISRKFPGCADVAGAGTTL